MKGFLFHCNHNLDKPAEDEKLHASLKYGTLMSIPNFTLYHLGDGAV